MTRKNWLLWPTYAQKPSSVVVSILTLPTNHSVPLPDPVYLALHAVCAEVANLSGVGEHIDNILCWRRMVHRHIY